MHIKPQSAEADIRADQFSDLELQCLGHLAQGRQVEEFCASLSLTESVAQDMIAGVEAKLGARNRLHAVILALRLGILEEALRIGSE